MTEYRCSCVIDNRTHELFTLGAATMSQAVEQLKSMVCEEGFNFDRAECLMVDAVEDLA
jgi:hypothetical protein